MQQIIQFIVVAIFIFIIYIRKIKPYLSKKKSAKSTIQDSISQSPGNPENRTDIRTDTALTNKTAALSHNPHHDIIVVDYAEIIDSSGFENRLTSRLVKAETELTEKGCTYCVDFFTLNTAVIAVISYTF